MGNHHHRAIVVTQGFFQPCHAFGVQMVGWFVQQQQVRFFQQQAAQRHTAALTTGEFFYRAIRWRAAQGIQRNFQLAVQFPAITRIDFFLQFGLFSQQGVHFIVFHGFGKTGRNLVETIHRFFQVAKTQSNVFAHSQFGVELGFLLQVANTHALGGPGFPTIFLINPCHNLEQGGLTRTINTQNTNFGTGHEGKGDPLEHFAPTGIGFCQILHHIDVLIGCHDDELPYAD